MGELANQIQNAEIKPANTGKTLQDIIQKSWSRIASVAPKHLNPERLYQIAISTINTTPELGECSPASILSCLMTCSALGLEPSAVDGLGRAYILPYRNKKTGRKEAQIIIGYKGMIDLARRSGEIKSIEAHAVYKGDEFTYSYGLNSDLVHVPKNESNELTHAYMVAHFVNGGYHFEVLTKAEIDKVKNRSAGGKSSYSPWSTDYEAMACKTAIRRAFKYLPVSTETMRAVEADSTSGSYIDSIEIEPVITSTESEEQETIDTETGEVIEHQ